MTTTNKHRRLGDLDMAYEIIDLHERNLELELQVEHYKSLWDSARESMDHSAQCTIQNIGSILKASLDPNSVINRGFAAIEADKLKVME